MKPISHTHGRGAEGFSLVDMMLSMGLSVLVIGAAMQALAGAFETNHTVMNVTDMNRALRTGLDMMTRDLLSAGDGLPAGRQIPIPSGANSLPMLLPGPPGSNFATQAGDAMLPAVLPGPGLGPSINGTATDIVTILAVDGSFENVALTALAAGQLTVATPVQSPDGMTVTNTGPSGLLPGQLLMLDKGTSQVLVQVTDIAGQVVRFAANDSMRVNQPNAGNGSTNVHLGTAPPDVLPPVGTNPRVIPTTASRIKMVTYYLDNITDPRRPRLVRRMNNGHPFTFDNNLGATLAFDVHDLQITYDLFDGGTNPTNVDMTLADQSGTGRCAPEECGPGQIRKINIRLTAAGRKGAGEKFYTTLTSQVSLRSMSLVNLYQ
jgi:hypothetical protein